MDNLSAIERAERLIGKGKINDAFALLHTAGENGDVDALFRLATWHLIGVPIKRDIIQSTKLLRRAVEIGHVDAALMEIALTANGSGAEADWTSALMLLNQAAKNDPVAQAHRAILATMELDGEGYPRVLPQAELISENPEVQLFRNFFSQSECAHVAAAARELLEPTVVIDPKTGENIPHPIRTSFGATLGPTREDLVIAALNRRLAAISNTNLHQGEPLSILCYTQGQEYRPHYDWIAGATNQRVKTIIVYLNDGYVGGETEFLSNRFKFIGHAGDAIMFDDTTTVGSVARDSQHAGLPVKSGTKWVATRWIRETTFDVWNDC
jgi:prolyl 4-hydroxylase